jgi:uncharacterized membrane protein
MDTPQTAGDPANASKPVDTQSGIGGIPGQADGRRHHTLWRTGLALLAAAAAIAMLPTSLPWPNRLAVGWLAGAGVFLAIAWYSILRFSATDTRDHAVGDDPGRAAVLVVVIAASTFSFLAATQVIAGARTMVDSEQKFLWTALGCAAVAASWLLTHTVYALRYAHMYYRRHHHLQTDKNVIHGMIFPGEKEPCDLDFAYFAFTLGICFQTSDIAIDSTRVRRTVLVHVLLAFVYNTTILGLVISLLGSLLG